MIRGRAGAPVLLSLLSLSLLADVPVSEPMIRPAANWRSAARIASNGRELLVVWFDAPDELRARRISATGQILDPVGLHVARSREGFDVASDGVGWLIAHTTQDAMRVVRVEPDGTVGEPVSLSPMTHPALAWNGSSFLVAGDNVTGVNVRTLDRGGQPLHNWITLAPGGTWPAIAANGSKFLVAWWTNAVIEAATFAGGRAGPVQRIGESTWTWPPALASNGGNWLLAWTVNNAAGDVREIRARPVSADGALGTSEIVEMFSGAAQRLAPDIGLAPAGTNYLVTWRKREGESPVTAAHLFDFGRALHEPFIVTGVKAAPPKSFAVAPSGTWFVWASALRFNAGAPDVIEIEAKRLNEPTVVELAFSAGEQSAPFAIRHAGRELVAWSEQVGVERKPTVFTARVTPAGPLDGEGVVAHASASQQLDPVLSAAPEPLLLWNERSLDNATTTTLVAKPFGSTLEPSLLGTISAGAGAAVWTGSEHFVVWRSGQAVVAVRVLPSGVVLDATPIRLADSARDPRVASDGTNVLVGWTSSVMACSVSCFPQESSIVRLFSREGAPLAPAVKLADADRSAPSVVWNGSEFAVFRMAISGLHGARISSDGALLGEHPLGAFGDVSLGFSRRNVPAGWTGADYAVALPSAFGVHLLRVSRDLRGVQAGIIDTQAEEGRPFSIVTSPAGAIAVVYERILRNAPWGGAQRALLHYSPARRRAVR